MGTSLRATVSCPAYSPTVTRSLRATLAWSLSATAACDVPDLSVYTMACPDSDTAARRTTTACLRRGDVPLGAVGAVVGLLWAAVNG